MPPLSVSDEYSQLLTDLKDRIRQSRVRAAQAVNRELVLLYWQIGREILQRQTDQGWGSKVVDRIAKDLRHEFPEMKGFSPRNLHYMRAFAETYTDEAMVQQTVANLPWGHNVRLMEAVKDPEERLWYAQQAITRGWSRNILLTQIDNQLYNRQKSSAITNFERTLPEAQSDLAQDLIKNSYTFDFLAIAPGAQERDVHKGLVDHIRNFLLELGVGFAFVGSQYHLEVGGEDFFIDLLFYHLTLRCFVVIDLKMGDFQPEFSGKMNFYVSAVDDLLRHAEDRPTIGMILCRSKNKTIAEYALRDVQKPIGISIHRTGTELPDPIKQQLPSPERLEAALENACATVPEPSDQP
ncbi:PDDEXK nuclease domain-containing protein [Oscillatoria sp. CS-180]|uniref:PDDEXK nuclease domain-containing protein n=1 Tax=Oscillatoria sp. CS-180 TaxID=3021720 RepID=UPI00232D6024|nr:PDDEXK nuclease domain-containing protein [Oscillatoria sp. CS-180]MDB9529421.1 PDDEXK nuclease domain-containing protein [Oscillatoria sp. CS-180]